jgi:hypothetical protein
MTNVGYEKWINDYGFCVESKPNTYQAQRIKNGRRTHRSEEFSTEREADEWIERQRQLDADDRFRETGKWRKE